MEVVDELIKEYSGINRYIMECKSSSNSERVLRYLELIDTLWNVNSERQVVIRSPQQN